MNQFIYFVCIEGNKDLLKEEIKIFFPNLKFSFSQKGFLTFKNSGPELNDEEIKNLNPCFALKWGRSTNLEKEFIESQLKAQESLIRLPEEAPSRAYLKIAEACTKFKISPNKEKNWMEFGCAPGGAIYYLCQNFNKIYGIDPAEMDSRISDLTNFRHLNFPIQNLTLEKLPKEKIHYITSDLNLNPKQAISEVLRISKIYQDSVEAIFMTIKLVKLSHVKEIPNFVLQFEKAGFKNISKIQLPSHKREFLILALK